MKMLAKHRQAVIHRQVNLRGLGTDEPRRHFLEQPVEACTVVELFRLLPHDSAPRWNRSAKVAEMSTQTDEIKTVTSRDIGQSVNLFHEHRTRRKD